MPETILSPGNLAVNKINKINKKSCPHGTYTVVGLKIRKSGSKAGSAINHMDLSFLDDKTLRLEEVNNLRHHTRGCLEMCREAFVIIITGGCC